MVISQVGLNVLKYLLQLFSSDRRRIGYRVADVFLNSRRR
jgi:hypothetical protein